MRVPRTATNARKRYSLRSRSSVHRRLAQRNRPQRKGFAVRRSRPYPLGGGVDRQDPVPHADTTRAMAPVARFTTECRIVTTRYVARGAAKNAPPGRRIELIRLALIVPPCRRGHAATVDLLVMDVGKFRCRFAGRSSLSEDPETSDNGPDWIVAQYHR
jgi:hypothetical protein